MKLITAVVRPDRLGAVKEALFRVGVTGMTLSRVSGHGGERELVEHYRGSALVLEFRDKVKIEMAVSEPFVEPTIEAILSSARTGAVGDGKIFVQELERVVRIRTGERDTSALTPITADDVQRRANEEALSQDALDDAALDALEALGCRLRPSPAPTPPGCSSPPRS